MQDAPLHVVTTLPLENLGSVRWSTMAQRLCNSVSTPIDQQQRTLPQDATLAIVHHGYNIVRRNH